MDIAQQRYYLLSINTDAMFEKTLTLFTSKINWIIQSGDSPLKKAEKGIKLCNTTLSQFQNAVEKEDFESVEAEIDFFRNIKPIPMSYLIYFTEVRTCELSIPKTGARHQIRFFEKEVKKINKFFSRNNDFVNYMEQSHNYLDHQFFTRNNLGNFPFAPTINYYQYPEFSTSHDMLWSKIQAMYRFIHYIREGLKRLQPGSKYTYTKKQPRLLLWSGTKTALVELIYAIHANGDLNHGAVELSRVASSFEDFFNIKLDNFYKTYSEIRSRKGSRSKYLESLIIRLEVKMNQDDEK